MTLASDGASCARRPHRKFNAELTENTEEKGFWPFAARQRSPQPRRELRVLRGENYHPANDREQVSPRRPAQSLRRGAPYPAATLVGSTLNPGPMVEETLIPFM